MRDGIVRVSVGAKSVGESYLGIMSLSLDLKSIPHIPDGHDENLKILDGYIEQKDISKSEQTSTIACCTFWKYNDRPWSLPPNVFKRRWFRFTSRRRGIASLWYHREKRNLPESGKWDPFDDCTRRDLDIRGTRTRTPTRCMCHRSWGPGCGVGVRKGFWNWNNKNRIESVTTFSHANGNGAGASYRIASQSMSIHEAQLETIISPALGFHFSATLGPLLIQTWSAGKRRWKDWDKPAFPVKLFRLDPKKAKDK